MLPGVWRDIGLWFTWRPELATLQMGAPLDLKAPVGRLHEASRLVVMVNERLWIGHFEIWHEDGTIVFRHALTLPEAENVSVAQAATMIEAAKEAGERLYPAFHYLLWSGKTPLEAVAAAMFDTAGEA